MCARSQVPTNVTPRGSSAMLMRGGAGERQHCCRGGAAPDVLAAVGAREALGVVPQPHLLALELLPSRRYLPLGIEPKTQRAPRRGKYYRAVLGSIPNGARSAQPAACAASGATVRRSPPVRPAWRRLAAARPWAVDGGTLRPCPRGSRRATCCHRSVGRPLREQAPPPERVP
eukprot:1637622-Prymnesium_polylepis.2